MTSMAAKAFVLIETGVNKTRKFISECRQLKGVQSVDAVTGPYDAIVIIESGSLNEIGDIITDKIHQITGISRTVTCLVLQVD